MPTTGRGTSGGETPAKDLLFDIEADLSGEEEIYSIARRRGLRLRFSPRQAEADAYTGAVDGVIEVLGPPFFSYCLILGPIGAIRIS